MTNSNQDNQNMMAPPPPPPPPQDAMGQASAASVKKLSSQMSQEERTEELNKASEGQAFVEKFQEITQGKGCGELSKEIIEQLTQLAQNSQSKYNESFEKKSQMVSQLREIKEKIQDLRDDIDLKDTDHLEKTNPIKNILSELTHQINEYSNNAAQLAKGEMTKLQTLLKETEQKHAFMMQNLQTQLTQAQEKQEAAQTKEKEITARVRFFNLQKEMINHVLIAKKAPKKATVTRPEIDLNTLKLSALSRLQMKKFMALANEEWFQISDDQLYSIFHQWMNPIGEKLLYNSDFSLAILTSIASGHLTRKKNACFNHLKPLNPDVLEWNPDFEQDALALYESLLQNPTLKKIDDFDKEKVMADTAAQQNIQNMTAKEQAQLVLDKKSKQQALHVQENKENIPPAPEAQTPPKQLYSLDALKARRRENLANQEKKTQQSDAFPQQKQGTLDAVEALEQKRAEQLQAQHKKELKEGSAPRLLGRGREYTLTDEEKMNLLVQQEHHAINNIEQDDGKALHNLYDKMVQGYIDGTLPEETEKMLEEMQLNLSSLEDMLGLKKEAVNVSLIKRTASVVKELKTSITPGLILSQGKGDPITRFTKALEAYNAQKGKQSLSRHDAVTFLRTHRKSMDQKTYGTMSQKIDACLKTANALKPQK